MKTGPSLLALLCALSTGCATYNESLTWNSQIFFEGWGVAREWQDANQQVSEFVPEGQSAEEWTELLTMQTFRKSSVSPDIEALAAAASERLSKRCPGKVALNVIERSGANATEEASILYEWSAKGCPPDADQHELARIIYGRFNVFRVAWAMKTSALPPEKRQLWIQELRKASIIVMQ